MSRGICRLLAPALLSLATGCTMCASPYDYCGPTFNAKGDPCYVVERAGSIFAPAGDMYYGDPSVAPSELPTPGTSTPTPVGNSGSELASEIPPVTGPEAASPAAPSASRLQPSPDAGANLAPQPRIRQARSAPIFRR